MRMHPITAPTGSYLTLDGALGFEKGASTFSMGGLIFSTGAYVFPLLFKRLLCALYYSFLRN